MSEIDLERTLNDPAGAAAAYLTRGRSSTRCRGGARVAFDPDGFLEYCS